MWELVRQNKIKTLLLMLVLGIVLLLSGYLFAEIKFHNGLIGLSIASVLWIFHFGCSYFMGDSLFLQNNRAEKVHEQSLAPTLWNVTEEMAIASGMATLPNIYIIDDNAPNAFAVGRDPEHASIAVTSGLIKLCSRDELQGVIAHELAHINNRDSLYMMMAASMISIISSTLNLLTSGRHGSPYSRTYRSYSQRNNGSNLLLIVPAILISILTTLIYYSISRKREYLADATGAIYTRYPEGLASALEKISSHHQVVTSADTASAPLYIINPLKNSLAGLFSTHPSVESRIQILRSMGGTADFSSYSHAYQSVLHTQETIVPQSAIKNPSSTFATEPTPALVTHTPDTHADQLSRHREATDTLWKLHDYHFIHCDCGTNLKIPPQYSGKTIACPHCHKSYTIDV